MMRRGDSEEGVYYPVVPETWNDVELFKLLWSPLTTSLSFIFNSNSSDERVRVVG